METRHDRRHVDAELRAAEVGDGVKRLRGYAALFNTPTLIGDLFWEVIRPGAFDAVLATSPDVRCLWNHDDDTVLGRTVNGTLRLGVDDAGLWYETDLPATVAASDAYILVQRGDVSQSSFTFSVEDDGERWGVLDGKRLREIVSFDALLDVSPVIFPAYQQTSVSARTIASANAHEINTAGGSAGCGIQTAKRLQNLTEHTL